ncbi:hypothetical protein LEP1GSC060_1070 [Leptospira weilii serovar Ranarum str. ICFT]|uniref:Uncharacterized protein n=1 Tax=Leptospira weilii serovar Ranarum str. ICFT TaxID=1218598 RepID=N1WJD0_9LEPT|nr:hypothetical protein LEP1GSC060_1070 [Leptospira weilii serovar Ranarum str. ICFT]
MIDDHCHNLPVSMLPGSVRVEVWAEIPLLLFFPLRTFTLFLERG